MNRWIDLDEQILLIGYLLLLKKISSLKYE